MLSINPKGANDIITEDYWWYLPKFDSFWGIAPSRTTTMDGNMVKLLLCPDCSAQGPVLGVTYPEISSHCYLSANRIKYFNKQTNKMSDPPTVNDNKQK